MNRKYERPEVKQITKQWVRENCKNVTERDMGLLRIIHQHRLLRRDQLQVLYPEFPSTDFLNKRLKLLYDKHIIDRVYPPMGLGKGSAKQHLCIDRAGAILLGLDSYNKPISTDAHGTKTLPLGWEHRIMINDYKCSITRACKNTGSKLKLCWIERPYQYNDTKIIPDITCLVTNGGKGYLFFIEVDLGTEDIPYIKRKIDSYKNYYMSKQWYKEKWAQVFKAPMFPRVLFFTLDGRIKRQKYLQEYTSDSSIDFVFGFHEKFEHTLNHIIKS